MSVKTRSDEQELHNLKTSRVKLPDIQVSNRYKGLRVLGLVADSSACGYYRVINPLHMLRMHGATVTYSTFHTADSFFTHDVIVVPRQHNPDVLEILKTASFDGKLLVYEIDDDLDSVDPSSPAYMVYHNGSPELRLIPEFMYTCHGVTVTTPELARWYYQNQQNVVIVENHIDYSFRNWGADVEWDAEGNPKIALQPIEKPAHRQGKISILWSGGSTHQLDLEEIGPSVRAILNRYPHVQFCFYGSAAMCQDFIKRYNLPEDQVEAVSPRHFLDYPEGLHGFDIGLAPIHCSQFNLCKCVVGDTRIHTVGGGSVRISDIHPGREADTFYKLDAPLLVQTQNGPKEATHFYCGGEVESVKFRTSMGYELEASPTHRIKNSGDEWVRMSDLQVGSQVLLSPFEFGAEYQKIPYLWVDTKKGIKVADHSLAKGLPTFTVDEKWGELLGFMLGDGHLGRNGHMSICVSGKDPDLVERISDLFRHVGLEPTVRKAANRDMYYVNANCKPLSSFLVTLGLCHNKAQSKEQLAVPEVIWRSPKSVVRAFLRALFESDGSIANPNSSKQTPGLGISSCSESLMKDVQKLLMGFGIPVTRRSRTVKYQTGVSSASYLRMNRAAQDVFCQEIGFISQRKSEALAYYSAKPTSNAYKPLPVYDVVEEVTNNKALVFDVSVPDGEQWLGDTFVQHNSFLRLEEYGAVGLASIASNVGPYTRFAKRHPGLVSLVGKGKDCFPNWVEAMKFLIENPEEMERRKAAVREVVAQNYALEFNFHQWPKAWDLIFSQRAKGLIGPPEPKMEKSWYKSYGRAGRNDPCPCGSGLKVKDCCVDAWG